MAGNNQQNGISIVGAGIPKQFIQCTNVVLQDIARMRTAKVQYQGDEQFNIVGEDRGGADSGGLEITSQMTPELYKILKIMDNKGNARTSFKAETIRGDFKGFVWLDKLPPANYHTEVTYKFLFERNEVVG